MQASVIKENPRTYKGRLLVASLGLFENEDRLDSPLRNAKIPV